MASLGAAATTARPTDTHAKTSATIGPRVTLAPLVPFTEGQLTELRKAFAILDSERTGSIGPSHVLAAISHFDKDVTVEQVSWDPGLTNDDLSPHLTLTSTGPSRHMCLCLCHRRVDLSHVLEALPLP